jgi:hypothetical protein
MIRGEVFQKNYNNFTTTLAKSRFSTKINLLITILTRFRDALAKEITLIEKAKAK